MIIGRGGPILEFNIWIPDIEQLTVIESQNMLSCVHFFVFIAE